MKRLYLLLYAWGSTFLLAAIIYWLATVPNLDAGNETTDQVVKVLFRMTLYAIFFIFVYRSIILTLKSTVTRLASWRSKREESEDAEFVLIIETLVVIVTVLSTTLFSAFEEYTQTFVDGREGDIKDVLVSMIAILLTAIISYSIPVVGELEMAIKHRFEEVNQKKKSKKASMHTTL